MHKSIQLRKRVMAIRVETLFSHRHQKTIITKGDEKMAQTIPATRQTSASTPDQNNTYSYHTFMFPFIWEDECNALDFLTLSKSFRQSGVWVYDNLIDDQVLDTPDRIRTSCEKRQLYSEYQYFYPAVRAAMYGFDSNIVENFSYRLGESYNCDGKKASIVIEKEENTYRLHLNGIRLKLFNTGVGILIFEMENRDYRSFSDVKNINA